MPHEIIMPALGMAQDTGLLVAWHKQTGDPVRATDILMEVETDKTTMEVEAGVSGFVAELRVQAGEEVPVGGVVAVVCESPDELPAVSADERADSGSASAARLAIGPASVAAAGTLVADSTVTGSAVTDSPVAGSPVAPSNAVAPASSAAYAGQAGRILASPKARRLARERGLDLQQLVRQGVAEPIHAADLENLSAAGQGVARRPPSPQLTQARHTTIDFNPLGVVASPSTRRLAARADIDLEQLASELGQDCISRTDVENRLADGKPGATNMPTAGPSLSPWNIDHAHYGPVEPRLFRA